MRMYLVVVLALSLGPIVGADEPEVLFKDGFDAKLGEGWSWLREHRENWRIKEGALEIKVQPGKAHNVQNALVRKAPGRNVTVEVTVSNNTAPTQQYEQGGITLYRDGKPIFKLVKERIDGKIYIIPGKKPVHTNKVRLRVEIGENKLDAWFRPDGQDAFQKAGSKNLPPPKNDQISIQCYNGPPNANHWIRFDDFKIWKNLKK